MKVAVTGAGGFLGRALVERLPEAGHVPLAIVRRETDAAELREMGVASICADLSDEDGCIGIFKGYQAVVHCAVLRHDFGRWVDFKRMNIDITRHVMENARAEGVDRIVHISTTAVYGNERNHCGTDEEANYGERNVDYYTRSKIEGDRIVSSLISEKKLPAIILRPSYIWGPGDKAIIPYIVDALKRKRLLLADNGDNLLSLSFIDNVVEAIIITLENDKAIGRTFNITDGSKVTSKKFINDIMSILGIDYKLKGAPYPLLYGAAFLMEWYYRLTRRYKTPPFTRFAARFLKYDAIFDISRAIYDLGYEPKISYKEAMTLLTPYIRSLYYGGK